MFIQQDGQQFEKDDRFKLDFNEVKASLSKVKKGTGGWWVALCPAHADSNPSLAFTEAGGNVGFHCFSGCSYENIVRALGMWKDTPSKRIEKRIVATYDYKDENGVLKYQVVRYEPKDFRQRRPDGKDNWVYNLEGVVRVLYNLPAIVQNPGADIYIVEGEKDADNLFKKGVLATTNSGGASKWEKSFNKYFANRNVIIIADNDTSGVEHAEKISKEIYRISRSVKIVVLPVEEKGDVSDYLAEGNTVEDLKDFCDEIEALSYTDEELQQDPTESHNIEAEWAVIGAVFKNPILIGKLIDKNIVHHLYNSKTKLIASAMVKCFEDKEDVNYITVGEKLGKDLVKVGGYEFLNKLDEDLPEVFDIDSWINLIVSKSQYRELAKIGKSLSVLAETEGDTVGSITETFASKVYGVKEQNAKSGLEKLGDNLESVLTKAQLATGQGLTGISTGLIDLDYITSGWQDTDLIIVAGRPSTGKTTCVINTIAHAAIHEQKSVAFFSLEMNKDQITEKIICAEAMVSGTKLKNGELNSYEWDRIAQALPKLDSANLYIDETPGISIPEIRSKVMRLKQEEGLDLVAIDYLQLMSGRGENRQQEISGISRELKGLAKEFKVPVIALSQLNRSPEGRSGNRPMLSDLRESGSLEQDADMVVLLYRDDYYKDDVDNQGIIELIIPKHRNGATGTVEAAFLREYSKFLNLFPKYENNSY